MRSQSSAYVSSRHSAVWRQFVMCLAAVLCLAFSSCRQSEDGNRILSPHRFSKVLTDVYLTEAMLSQMDAAKKVEWIRGLQPKYFQDVSYRWILDKYHITEDDFYASVSYYSGRGHDMIEILNDVESRLNELKSENDELMAAAEKEEKRLEWESSWKTVNIDPQLSILCAEMTRLDSLYEDELSRSPRELRKSRVLAVEKEWKKNFDAGLVKLNFTKDGLTVVSGRDTTSHSRYFNHRMDALEQQYQALSEFQKKNADDVIPDSLLLDWKEAADIMEPVDAGLWTVLTDSSWFEMLSDTSWTRSDFCLRGGLCQCGDTCHCKDTCSCAANVSTHVEYLSAFDPCNNGMGHLWAMAIRTREAIQAERARHPYPSDIFKEVIPDSDSEEEEMTNAQMRKARRQEEKLQKALAKTLKEAEEEHQGKQQSKPSRKARKGKQVSKKVIVPAESAGEAAAGGE